MSVLDIETTCFQRLEIGFDLSSFFIKCLCFIWFVKRYFFLKFWLVFSVNNSGCRKIAEFSVDTGDITIKGPFIYPETAEQPGSFDPMTIARYLNLKIFSYTNMILNV